METQENFHEFPSILPNHYKKECLPEQQEDGDWLFFGYCHIQEWEWGYVLLSQIQEVNVRGLTVQLDKGLKTGITVKACLN